MFHRLHGWSFLAPCGVDILMSSFRQVGSRALLFLDFDLKLDQLEAIRLILMRDFAEKKWRL